MKKCGTADKHCCWFQGEECVFVEPSNRENYKWQCALKVKYGTWEAVHESPEYLESIKPKMLDVGYSCNCGDWPIAGVSCNDCGEVG